MTQAMNGPIYSEDKWPSMTVHRLSSERILNCIGDVESEKFRGFPPDKVARTVIAWLIRSANWRLPQNCPKCYKFKKIKYDIAKWKIAEHCQFWCIAYQRTITKVSDVFDRFFESLGASAKGAQVRREHLFFLCAKSSEKRASYHMKSFA